MFIRVERNIYICRDSFRIILENDPGPAIFGGGSTQTIKA